jgi:hypothetical protein
MTGWSEPNVCLCRKRLVVFLTALMVSALVGVNRVAGDETRSPWPVPEKARSVKNPIKPSAEGLKAAA